VWTVRGRRADRGHGEDAPAGRDVEGVVQAVEVEGAELSARQAHGV
jgi:hypothetical protein